MRYSVLNEHGVELSIAIEESAFSKPITLDPKTGQPTSYEALGFSLGFSDDTTRTPHSDASVKAAEKGTRYLEQRAATYGQTAASVTEPVKPVKPVKASEPSNPEANKAPAAAGKGK